MLSLKKKMLIAGRRKLRPQDVFATSLYTGNGSSQTITNGLDLAGKGGLVWSKARNGGSNHVFQDTKRGGAARLFSNSTEAENTGGQLNFLASGFQLTGGNEPNSSGATVVSWAFLQAKGFLSIVAYTGNGVSGRQIPHDLGSVPGMIVVKRLDAASDWVVRTGPPKLYSLALNSTNGDNLNTANGFPGSTSATTFSVFAGGSGMDAVNAVGGRYVAHVWAHNPDLIDCGSYTGNGGASSGVFVTCGTGWRPQWLMLKGTSISTPWYLFDTARGIGTAINGSDDMALQANSPNAEMSMLDISGSNAVNLTTTGFNIRAVSGDLNQSGQTYISMAIREPT